MQYTERPEWNVLPGPPRDLREYRKESKVWVSLWHFETIHKYNRLIPLDRELNLFHDEPPMILYTIYGCPVRCLALDLPRGNHTLHTLAKTLSKWCKIEAIRLDRCDALVTLSTFEDAVRYELEMIDFYDRDGTIILFSGCSFCQNWSATKYR